MSGISSFEIHNEIGNIFLNFIINSLDSGVFPDKWVVSMIIPAPKIY